ncbi:MAG: hypothetical protein IIW20_02035, partial [Clostridia bacterium]|nr:hypothetical protein [Clostridia bacterium]
DKKLALAKTLIILFAVILLGGLALFTIKFPVYSAVLLLIVLYVIKVLWGLTSIEYEYILISGELSMDKIYSTRKRKHLTEFKVSEAESITPYSSANLEGAKVIFAATSVKDDDVYCAIYKENGVRTALVFNVNEKALQMLRYYNKATVIK